MDKASYRVAYPQLKKESKNRIKNTGRKGRTKKKRHEKIKTSDKWDGKKKWTYWKKKIGKTDKRGFYQHLE